MGKINLTEFLFNEYPLVISPNLAAKIGLNEAIILQQIQYWILKNKKEGRNFIDGKHWTYNSVKEWQKQFPFWSYDTIKRSINSLLKLELIIKAQHSTNPFDKSFWYTINYDVLQNFPFENAEEDLSDDEDHDRLVQNAPIGRMGVSRKKHLKPAINALVQNAPIGECKMHQSYTETNNTDIIEREKTENSFKIIFEKWNPNNIQHLQSEYGLTENDIKNAAKEFKLDTLSKGKSYENIDASFELWCSRYKETKKPYQKSSKTEIEVCKDTISNQDDTVLSFQDYIHHVLYNLGEDLGNNIQVDYNHRNSHYIDIQSKNAKAKEKLSMLHEQILDLLRSIKNLNSPSFNKYHAIELYHLRYAIINGISYELLNS